MAHDSHPKILQADPLPAAVKYCGWTLLPRKGGGGLVQGTPAGFPGVVQQRPAECLSVHLLANTRASGYFQEFWAPRYRVLGLREPKVSTAGGSAFGRFGRCFSLRQWGWAQIMYGVEVSG